MSLPDFSFFKGRSIVSAKTGRGYMLEPVTALPGTPETIENIVSICNEPDIYDVLFKKKCQGKPYTSENGESFLNWAKKGWDENTHFVFVLRDDHKRHIGTVDIKSNDTNMGEIGYWASAKHQGVMTPAVQVLCEIAQKAGFKSLCAYTAVPNQRSQKVLLNNGFTQQPDIVLHNEKYSYFFRKAL